MKLYLITGVDYATFGEPFDCDLFVEAENPEDALAEWKKYAAEEWGVESDDIEVVRIFEVPPISTPAGKARALSWHKDVIDVNEREGV